MKTRLAKIRSLLDGRGQRLTVGWTNLGRLERTFLLVVRVPRGGTPRVARVAGTLRIGEATGQELVSFSTDLVRVMSGRRKGLAVLPESLGDEETFCPAGMLRDLTDAPARGFGNSTRRERELLDNVEELLSRPVVELPSMPEPDVVKSAFKPEAFVPRFTGETYRVVRATPGYEPDESMLENFNRLVTLIASRQPDGAYDMSFRLAARGGVTTLLAPTDRCWALPSAGLDVKSDLFEVRVERSLKRKDGFDGAHEAERRAEGVGAP